MAGREEKKRRGEGGRKERSKDPPFIGFKSAWQFLAGWLAGWGL